MVGNTHDLQNHKSEIGSWFKQTAAKVNPRNLDTETSQGFYVVAADGSAYVFNNNRSVERVLGTLDKGLAGFKTTPPSAVEVPTEKQWTPEPPPGTTVLRVYSRIKPLPLGCDTSNENVQRDHFWLLAEELAALRHGQVLESLRLRLCRFGFVDAIRGEPEFWQISEIRSAEFSAKVVGNKVTLSGSFEMESGDSRRGIVGNLILEIGRENQVRGYAEATAWGASRYTPNPPQGKFPLKFAFVLAPKAPDTVAPQASMIGPEYLRGK